MSTQEVLVFDKDNITVYNQFEAQLKELEKWNDSAIFDYEDAKGNKEARSHIYKLRQTKSAVDKVRKEAGKDALEYKKLVDSKGNTIIATIQNMIDVHQKPLIEIENREKERVAKHQETIDCLQRYLNHDFFGESSETIENHIRSLCQFEPTEDLEEFMGPATKIYKEALNKAETALKSRVKYESEQLELERLRKEKAEQERKEREAKIAKEAAEKAKKDAEEKALREKQETQRKEEALRLEKERIEREKLIAEEQAKKALEESERRRIRDIELAKQKAIEEEKQKRLAEEAAIRAREEDKRHRSKINNAAVDALCENGFDRVAAKMFITVIAKKKIPNIVINY